MSGLSILFATSEIAPWISTGGLGDVAAALPAALHRAGHDIRVLIPAYPALHKAFPGSTVIAELPALAPALPPARLVTTEVDGLPLILLDCPELFARSGNPYVDALGLDWPDNAIRFGMLSRVAARELRWDASLIEFRDEAPTGVTGIRDEASTRWRGVTTTLSEHLLRRPPLACPPLPTSSSQAISAIDPSPPRRWVAGRRGVSCRSRSWG